MSFEQVGTDPPGGEQHVGEFGGCKDGSKASVCDHHTECFI